MCLADIVLKVALLKRETGALWWIGPRHSSATPCITHLDTLQSMLYHVVRFSVWIRTATSLQPMLRTGRRCLAGRAAPNGASPVPLAASDIVFSYAIQLYTEPSPSLSIFSKHTLHHPLSTIIAAAFVLRRIGKVLRHKQPTVCAGEPSGSVKMGAQ